MESNVSLGSEGSGEKGAAVRIRGGLKKANVKDGAENV